MRYLQITLLFIIMLFASRTVLSAEEQRPEKRERMHPPRYSVEVLRGPEKAEDTAAFRKKMKAHKLEARQKKQEIREMVTQLKAIEDPERKKVMNRIIRDLVAESFDLTSQRRETAIEAGEKQLELARKNLEEAKLSLQRREENREKHIDSFMKKLLSDDPDEVLGLKKKEPEVIPEKASE